MELLQKNKIVTTLLFIAISFLLFSHTAHFPFYIYDDFENISQNIHLQSNFFSNFIWFWQNSLTPIIYNIWQILSALSPTSQADFFRIFNIFVHGLNATLLYYNLSKIFSKHAADISYQILSFIIALIFLVHPVTTEAVIWASSLRTLLSGFFILLSLYFSDDDTNEYWSYVFLLLTFLTNPIFASMFLLKFLNSKKINLIEISITITITLVFLLLHSKNRLNTNYLSFIPPLEQFKLIIVSIFQYLKIAIIPYPILINYNINLTTVASATNIELVLKAFLILFFFFFPYSLKIAWPYKRIILFFQLFFLLSIAGNCGLFLHDYSILSTVSSRYAYFAPVAAWGIIILLVTLLIKPHLIKFSILTILILSFSNVYFANKWQNNNTIISDALIRFPKSKELTIVLANTFALEGDYISAINTIKHYLYKQPEDWETFLYLLELLGNNNRHNGNKLFASATIDKFGDYLPFYPPVIYFHLAKLFYNLNDHNEALKYILLFHSGSNSNKESEDLLSSIKVMKCAEEVKR